MDKETIGTVVAVAKQWWLKVNTKPIRMGALDGATFPHIMKVQYVVDGSTYTKRKWIGAGNTVPAVGRSDPGKLQHSTQSIPQNYGR